MARRRATAKAEPQQFETEAERQDWIVTEQRRILAEHDSAARDLDKQPKPAKGDAPVAPVQQATDDKGNVRPADDRYLTDKQIAERDAFLAEQPDDETKAAQQILADAGSSAVVTDENKDQEVLPNV